MIRMVHKDTGIFSSFVSNIFFPLFFVLTFIAIVNSLQTYYLTTNGVYTSSDFMLLFISRLLYFWYFLGLAFVVLWITKRKPLRKTKLVQWFAYHLGALFFSFIVHQILIYQIDKFILGREVKDALIYAVFNNPSVWFEILVYGLFLLGISLMEYRKIHRENEIKFSEMQVKLIQSRLHELRGRIHPQFVFNTLHAISELVHKKRNNDADHVLSLMSDFLRAVVYDSEQGEISLAKDIEFLNLYLEIQKISYQGNFQVNKVIDPDTLDATIPNILLQPLVEEMVCRIDAWSEFPYEIKITTTKNNAMLEIHIEDNLKKNISQHQGGGEDRAVEHVIKERLKQLYGDRQEFQFEYRWEKGTEIHIRIPFNPIIRDSMIILEGVS